MKLILEAVAIGFAAALMLDIVGVFVGFIGLLAPICGGFLAAYMGSDYMARGNYIDGGINGGLASGAAGFISTFIVLILVLVALPSYSHGSMGALAILVSVIINTIGGAVLGFIGGLIGTSMAK